MSPFLSKLGYSEFIMLKTTLNRFKSKQEEKPLGRFCGFHTFFMLLNLPEVETYHIVIVIMMA